MADSLFTRIIRGEISCYKIYEDELTFAFLDINPKTPGHTLIVSKKQVDEFQDLPHEDYIALMQAVKKIALRQKEVLGAKRIGLQVIGVDVPHAHVHVFPFSSAEEYRQPPKAAPDEELAALAKKLAF
ncbi:MAG: HIT family protein [Candidatus Saccharimonadales bacterium]